MNSLKISKVASLSSGCSALNKKLCVRQSGLRKAIVCHQAQESSAGCDNASSSLSRRQAVLGALAFSSTVSTSSAQALGFKKDLKKKKIPLEEYTDSGNGLKYYDLKTGNGEGIRPGDKVTVHFDCLYRGINVVSSRSARLLGGNRSVAEPYEFVAGTKLGDNGPRNVGDSAGGLFSGVGGPKPPPALSTAVIGMKDGGKRTVIVPPEQAFGDVGIQEIPAGATIELQIEVLSTSG